MLALPIIWFVNAFVWLRNLWRTTFRHQAPFVRLDLRGSLPEFGQPIVWWRRLLGSQERPSLMRLRRDLQRIADDPRVRGVVLVARDFDPGWATAQSLRDEIQTLRAAGKQVVAYLLTPDTRSYYSLCAADRMVMPPSATLALLGLRVEALFLKDALALAGLEAEVTAVSPYKSAGDQLTRTDMSPENRQQLENLLDQRFAALVESIAIDRNMSLDHVRELFDHAPYVGDQALQAGLVDELCYEDELAARLHGSHKTVGGDDHEDVLSDWQEAQRTLLLPYRKRQRRVVAVVSVEGAIAMGGRGSPLPLLGGTAATSDTVSQALRRVERSKRIAALVLHVDSPGGDAYASDLIWREVLRVQQKKPVVVSMGNVAASGGYYVSACADTIVAQPGTVTGSIGVVSLRPVAAGLLERLHVNTVVLTRGARTGLLSPTLPPTEDERRATHDLVFSLYEDFKRVVRAGRKMSDTQLEPIAGGRIWTGREASTNGLVDALGGLPHAIEKARELGGLEADPRAPVLLVHGSMRHPLPPLPFGKDDARWPIDATMVQSFLDDVMKPRLLAMLPFVMRD